MQSHFESGAVIPPCWNRAPRAEGRWLPTGRTVQFGTRAPGQAVEWGSVKPVCRWHPAAFEDRCATWDGRGIGAGGEPYPVAHRWNCNGCMWRPEGTE